MHGKCKTNCRGKFWKIGLLVIAGIAVLGLIVMLLWNWLMPAIFIGVHTIGYLQALGLLVLSKIIFGGLRGHGHCHSRWRHHHRCHTLSEEERAKLGASCGCGNSGEASEATPEQKGA